MADAVRTIVMQKNGMFHIANFTNISDGTGETNVKKVDLQTLLNSQSAIPSKCKLREVHWVIQGMTYIKLTWDHTTDDIMALLAGSGYKDYSKAPGLVDPASVGGDGSVLLTTVGAVNGGTYDITAVFELLA